MSEAGLCKAPRLGAYESHVGLVALKANDTGKQKCETRKRGGGENERKRDDTRNTDAVRGIPGARQGRFE